MALFPARTAWLIGVVAVGCVYARLSTSSDWNGEGEGGAGGEPSQAGQGGSGQGGNGGRGGSVSSGGEGATPPLGGEGGVPAVEEDVIHGVVLDQHDTPIPGVVVLIDDVELVSDAKGEVSLVDSGKQIFDVAIVDEAAKIAYVYEGVTRRELRLSVAARVGQALHSATVSGTAQTSVNESNLRVAFDDRRRGFGAIGTRNPSDVAPNVRYDLEATWGGADELNGRISAMNFVGSPIQNMPESYEFASIPLALAADDAKKSVDLELAPLLTRELRVAITALPGVTRFDTLIFGNFAFSNASPTADEAYVIPNDPVLDAAQLTAFFTLSCSSPEGSVNLVVPLNADTSDIEDECGNAPQLVSPQSGATDVTNDTPFVFEPELDGCHSFSITHQGTWSLLIITTKTQVIAPDLSKYGLSDAPHEVSWTAGSTSPCEGIDGYLAPIDREAPPATLDYAVRADRSASSSFSTAN